MKTKRVFEDEKSGKIGERKRWDERGMRERKNWGRKSAGNGGTVKGIKIWMGKSF